MSGFVYFIEAGGRVKIGYSTEPSARLVFLSTGSPFPLTLVAEIPGSIHAEKELHRLLVEHRAHREWFERAGKVDALLTAVLAGEVADASAAIAMLGGGVERVAKAERAVRPFDEIFAIWPSVQAMADDLGVGAHTARGWRVRGRIGVRHWYRLLQLPAAKAAGITADVLVDRALKSKKRGAA